MIKYKILPINPATITAVKASIITSISQIVIAVMISVNKANTDTMIREKTTTPPALTFLNKVAVLWFKW